MIKDIERRVVVGAVAMRQLDEHRSVIEGYGAVFGEETIISGGWNDFREQIEPGAFDEALTRDDVRALFNHQSSLVLGRTRAKTLALSVDAKGLHYVIDPPNTSYANDLRESITRGDVSQSSFAFRVLEDTWEKPMRSGELPLRKVRKIELHDVSPVTYPAYEGTSVSARAKDDAQLNAGPSLITIETKHGDRLRVEWAIVEAEC